MAQLNVISATIPAGESLSNDIDCTGGALVSLTMPAQWDPDSNMTFQVSNDGVNFHDMADFNGNESMLGVTANTTVLVPEMWAHSVAWIKLRSGRSGAPIPQLATRTFTLALFP